MVNIKWATTVSSAGALYIEIKYMCYSAISTPIYSLSVLTVYVSVSSSYLPIVQSRSSDTPLLSTIFILALLRRCLELLDLIMSSQRLLAMMVTGSFFTVSLSFPSAV